MRIVLREKFRPPSEILNLAEPVRAMLELGGLHLAEPWLNSLMGRMAARGALVKIPLPGLKLAPTTASVSI